MSHQRRLKVLLPAFVAVVTMASSSLVAQSKREHDLAHYKAAVERRIEQQWYPPPGDKSRTALVAFQIHSNGTESHLRIERSSGDEELDAAALLAVNEAAPFAELPKGAPPDLDMKFALAYIVHSTGKRTKEVVQGQHEPGEPTPVASEGDSVDFKPYMADLQRRIKKHWQPPKGDRSKRILTVFKVSKDGSVSNIKITKSSGVAPADEAARAAIEKAAPFWNLPEGSPSNVDIEFTFDYNVFKSEQNAQDAEDTTVAEKDGSVAVSSTSDSASAVSPGTDQTAPPQKGPKSPMTNLTDAVLVLASLAGCFLPSILNFKRHKKKRKQWLAANVGLAGVWAFVPDMLNMNQFIGTPILIVATLVWLFMIVDSMSDDRD